MATANELPPSTVYLNAHFSYTAEGKPLLHIAPANISDQDIENLVITVNFPEGVTPLQYVQARYQSTENDNLTWQTQLSYQVDSNLNSDNWELWGNAQTANPETNNLLNPPVGTTETLTQPLQIRSVRLDYGRVPVGFRWRGAVQDQPTFALSIPADYQSDWAEVCLSATGELISGEPLILQPTCKHLRVIDPVTAPPNLNLRVETVGAANNPRPGDTITFVPTIQQTNSSQGDLDLVVELPSWLEFITTTNNLEFTPGPPPTATGTIELAPQLPQFEQRFTTDSGRMRLVWRWPEFTNINAITMPVIQTEMRPGLPVGTHEIPFTVLSNDNLSCWNLPAGGRDVIDVDLDQNKAEHYCRTVSTLQIESVAGIVADLTMSGAPAAGNPIAANLTLQNGGTQPITTIQAVVPVPDRWLIVPPHVPPQYTVAYSTSDNWCNGAANCDPANWTHIPPDNMRQTTAIQIRAEQVVIPAGSSGQIQLFLQPPADLEANTDILWPPIYLNGTAASGESVAFELTVDNIPVQAPPTPNVRGQAWLDHNRNGLFDDDQTPAPNIPVALISPGGDGEPATADDRILRWALSGTDGFYRFADILPGPYYLAAVPAQTPYMPTSLTVSNINETDQVTAFNSSTWRTGLFKVFRDQVSPPLNLSLTPAERQQFSGYVAFDQNQNQIWDDPITAGVNGLKVQLLDSNGETVAQTTTRTDSFGRAGSFLLEATNELDKDAVLRLQGNSPFVGGTTLSNGRFQLDLPATQEPVQVLIDQTNFGIDLGDAPASYGLAEHMISPAATLGLISDDESLPADWTADTPLPEDDTTALDDEEGIFFIQPGRNDGQDSQNHVVVVTRNQHQTAQTLNGWIDFNGDGRFSDDEKIIKNHPIFPNPNPQGAQFTFNTPEGAICGPTYARFRLGHTSSQPSGRDDSGEVEDIRYNIQCVTDLTLALEPQFTPMGPNELSNWYLSVTNSGKSTAEGVKFNVTIPGPVSYQGIVSLTNDPVACSDTQTARVTEVVQCEINQLAPGQTLTLNLAFFLPFDTDAKVIGSIGTVSSDTADRNPLNNIVRKNIKVEKSWVLIDPTYEPFTHVSYFPGIVNNPDLQELDFKQDTVIASVINVPISISVGIQTNRLPRLTVPTCVDNRDDEVTCNQTNFIDGQVIQEDYTIERIFFEDELIYEPEQPTVVRLNRIADPNMARCGQMGSCVGYDLFRVGRGGIFPYAWNAPNDYFYMALVTSGGRQINCPAEGYENRCFIKNDARPGDYVIEGYATVILAFNDTRLGPEGVEVRRKVNFNSRIRVVAPFVEPEIDGG